MGIIAVSIPTRKKHLNGPKVCVCGLYVCKCTHDTEFIPSEGQICFFFKKIIILRFLEQFYVALRIHLPSLFLTMLGSAPFFFFFFRRKMRHACPPPWGADGGVCRTPTD